MDQTQLEHELSIIKSMIEKTRNDTMESGSLFLFVGFGSIFFIGIVLVLEKMLLFTWIQPVMVALTILLGFVGFLVVRQREKQEKITTYTQRILLVLVLSCSVPMILTGLIFPMTNVYIWQLAPVFTALFFGVLLISSGAIFEFRFFYLGGILSWLGAIIMAYTLNSQLPIRAIVMICILIVGFIIPGILFNSKYKNAGQSNGS